MQNTEYARFYLPTHAMTLKEFITRIALATGNFHAAMADTEFGHHITVNFNNYRGYWITEYMWGGRVVLYRGSLRGALSAALWEHSKELKGGSVRVSLQAVTTGEHVMTLEEAKAQARDLLFKEGEEPDDAYMKEKDIRWKYNEASSAVNFERQGLGPYVAKLLEASTIEEYRKF